MILLDAIRWRAGGVLAGFVGAMAAVRLPESMLFEVRAENISLFGLAALLMMVVAIAAALVPSVRVARIDPVIALRND